MPARAGQNPPSATAVQELEKAQRPIRVGVQLVNLYATVRDKDRRLLADLTQQDFKVSEDGKEQKIEFFSREVNLPLTFGMLIDTSPSQERVLMAEQDAGERFLRRVLRKGDLVFVISFDIDVDLLSDLTGDHAALVRAISRARIFAPRAPGGVQGPFPQSGPKGTRLYDAIYLACKEKLAAEAGRKALIVLTDAVDAGSQVEMEEALEVAQRTDTVIHIIGVADYGFYGLGGYSGEGVAKKLAEQTGGRSIFVRNEKTLEEAFDQISEELRSQYTLGYYPSNTTRDGKFRKIEVKTTRAGARVLARKGYYAPVK